MWTYEALEANARKYGFFPLRPPQERALNGLAGGRDLLVVWPTGAGKSLVYQLPALAGDGLVLVVSPLIALMEDQTRKGRALKWPVTCVHSAMSKEEREKRLRAVEQGQVRLLYVTPERFRVPAFREMIQKLKVSLLAIDEAHCISQWGHDFRPDYSKLGEIRKILGQPQCVALTATATKEVQADICKQLNLSAPEVLWEGVERPNLHLAAEEFDHKEDKLPALRDWLRTSSGPKIIYFTLISTLEKVSQAIAEIPHEVYHGDLDDGRRKRAQQRFLGGDAELILATPAFGLGIDKPDIRGVLHYEIPGSLEAYFQEVGRAGRDQNPSHCLWLYCQEDLETQMHFIETLTPDPAYVKAVYELLVSWQDRLLTLKLDDLREQLSFKNKKDFRLETALSFLDRWEVIRYPQRRLDRLEFLRPLTDEDLSPELWAARRLQLQKKLMSLVQWFRSEECRKVGVYRYFGWSMDEPCGFCDRCEGA